VHEAHASTSQEQEKPVTTAANDTTEQASSENLENKPDETPGAA